MRTVLSVSIACRATETITTAATAAVRCAAAAPRGYLLESVRVRAVEKATSSGENRLQDRSGSAPPASPCGASPEVGFAFRRRAGRSGADELAPFEGHGRRFAERRERTAWTQRTGL